MFYVAERSSVVVSLTLSQMTNLRPFQTENACRQHVRVYENGRKHTKSIENTVGKGKIICNKQFLFFP